MVDEQNLCNFITINSCVKDCSDILFCLVENSRNLKDKKDLTKSLTLQSESDGEERPKRTQHYEQFSIAFKF